LYGSQARGTAREDSDIDLLLLSPDFDPLTAEQETRAWRTAFDIDWRIEPVLYGEKQYEENDWHPLILIAKREGIEIRAPERAVP
jgi:predicted nucleotidyltransferase